jgi:hypothetical protein
MRIRKISLTLAALGIALSVTASAALAQMDKLKSTTPEERAGAQTEMMKSKLALTPEQAPKIAAINQKYAKEMDPVIKGSEGPLMKMRHMKQINGKKEAALKRVLSPDQFQKYLASKEEMREQFEEKMEKR